MSYSPVKTLGTVTLTDQMQMNGTRKVKVTIQEAGGTLYLLPEGYGDYYSNDGIGVPVILELADNKLQLVVWGDINKQDYTHKIDLEPTRESLRTTWTVCSICKQDCALNTAHLHQGGFIGDECCWDERLKSSE